MADRILHFPDDVSVGLFYSYVGSTAVKSGDARGRVSVPERPDVTCRSTARSADWDSCARTTSRRSHPEEVRQGRRLQPAVPPHRPTGAQARSRTTSAMRAWRRSLHCAGCDRLTLRDRGHGCGSRAPFRDGGPGGPQPGCYACEGARSGPLGGAATALVPPGRPDRRRRRAAFLRLRGLDRLVLREARLTEDGVARLRAGFPGIRELYVERSEKYSRARESAREAVLAVLAGRLRAGTAWELPTLLCRRCFPLEAASPRSGGKGPCRGR